MPSNPASTARAKSLIILIRAVAKKSLIASAGVLDALDHMASLGANCSIVALNMSFGPSLRVRRP